MLRKKAIIYSSGPYLVNTVRGKEIKREGSERMEFKRRGVLTLNGGEKIILSRFVVQSVKNMNSLP